MAGPAACPAQSRLAQSRHPAPPDMACVRCRLCCRAWIAIIPCAAMQVRIPLLDPIGQFMWQRPNWLPPRLTRRVNGGSTPVRHSHSWATGRRSRAPARRAPCAPRARPGGCRASQSPFPERKRAGGRCVGMMRRGEDLALGALLDDAAIAHDDDPVSDRLHRARSWVM